MSLPIPDYLDHWLLPDCSDHNEFMVKGHIQCACGNPVFSISFIGEVCQNGAFICALDLENDAIEERREYFPLRVQATCTACAKSTAVYDRHKHGWNGFYAGRDAVIPEMDDLLQPKHCIKCQQDKFKIHTDIFSLGRADFKENAPEAPEGDWVNAFERIKIDLTCYDCHHTQKEWLDDECM